VAQKVQVILVDDLDGGEAEETVSFSLDGVSYEIDLSGENAAKLREAVAPYAETARRIGGRSSGRGGRGRGGGRGSSAKTAQIRSWAKSQGLEVNERGRIPAAIVEQYEKAQGA
jgi:Lsr2